ncbi:MAG: hypothetical protein K8T25_01630 [Planctomycetia bacterium]|nr:hypothetical protein [Planctomycetia bacterium]
MEENPCQPPKGAETSRIMLRFRFRLITLFVAIAIATVVALYAGSYYHLSRRGLREAKVSGLPGFLYVPTAEAVATHDLSTHHFLYWFYAPANWVDREFFGGEYPVGSILWDLQ